MIVAQAAGAVGTGEAIVFWILGPIALAGALGMVFARNAVHSALMLIVTMFCLAVFYIAGQAGVDGGLGEQQRRHRICSPTGSATSLSFSMDRRASVGPCT